MVCRYLSWLSFRSSLISRSTTSNFFCIFSLYFFCSFSEALFWVERLRARVLIHCLCEWSATAHCPARSLSIFHCAWCALSPGSSCALCLQECGSSQPQAFFSLGFGNGIRLFYFGCKLFCKSYKSSLVCILCLHCSGTVGFCINMHMVSKILDCGFLLVHRAFKRLY